MKKVLVISHNVFCKTSSMGKTLMAYFKDWDTQDIAQLYIHSEIPTVDTCANYYRMTDKEIIKSILTRKSGRIFSKQDIDMTAVSSRTDIGSTAKLYHKGKQKTPLIYLARNLWWSMGAWKTKKLLKWVDEFDPNVVFLASGDGAFIYKIALEIAKYKKIPLIVSCMDDYYFHNKNENRFLGKFAHRRFMKQVRKTMNYASCIMSICEKMSKDYSELFGKPCYTLHTPSSIKELVAAEKNNAISYIGNMGYKRHEQIVKLGQALIKLDCENKPQYIDVYSAENRPEILDMLTKENGINFHGSIPSEKVLEVMGKSMAVIHTESFDEITRKQVAYSVSTKIADSLASGTCIFAYGPGEVASIEYLKNSGAAYCITDDDNLEEKLRQFISDAGLREKTVANALRLAKENHDSLKNCDLVRRTIENEMEI